MKNTGLMTSQPKDNDLVGTIRKAFGKYEGNPPSLEQRLKGRSQNELEFLLKTAHFVKMAHGFTPNNKVSYLNLTRKMYPKVSFDKQQLIADMLNEADPIIDPEEDNGDIYEIKTKVLDDYSAELQKAYKNEDTLPKKKA